VAAPILASAIPAVAQESLAARVLRHKTILLENVRRISMDMTASSPIIQTGPHEYRLLKDHEKGKPLYSSTAERKMVVINERLIDRHPDLFIHQPMIGPVDLIGEKPVQARTRMLKAKYTFELAYDGIPPAGAEDALINYLVDEFASDLRSHGSPIHFYAPVLTSGIVIDPDTFSPVMGFMTRFGTAATS
jgi:hypothetical protein